MALFGSSRDISLFRHLNRELLEDIINQQCAFYKRKLEETKVNIYGESSGEKYYMGPVLINCLLERDPQSFSDDDGYINLKWDAKFRFLRDDLLDKNQDFNIDTDIYGADLVPEVGDIILYQEAYYEVNNVINNQYFSGKNPSYPNNTNPLNPGLEDFGSNISIICETNYISPDIVGLKDRLI